MNKATVPVYNQCISRSGEIWLLCAPNPGETNADTVPGEIWIVRMNGTEGSSSYILEAKLTPDEISSDILDSIKMFKWEMDSDENSFFYHNDRFYAFDRDFRQLSQYKPRVSVNKLVFSRKGISVLSPVCPRF